MEDYNYDVFELAREEPAFAAFQATLPVGSRAQSFPLEDLATGETVEMRSLWRGAQIAILEFGSFT
jgi:hypothetical protein